MLMIDAPADVASGLAGKLGMLPGVNVKTVYSKNEFPAAEFDELI